MSDLTLIRERVADLVENPNAELAEEIEDIFRKYETDSEALKNSVTVLAQEITGTDIEEDGTKEYVTIGLDGTIEINMQGYHGTECDEELKKISKALGAPVKVTNKPEYYESHKSTVSNQE
jgi:hypothetical protein